MTFELWYKIFLYSLDKNNIREEYFKIFILNNNKNSILNLFFSRQLPSSLFTLINLTNFNLIMAEKDCKKLELLSNKKLSNRIYNLYKNNNN